MSQFRTNAAQDVSAIPAPTVDERVALPTEEGRRWVALLESLAPEAWQAPSGCEGWTVRDLVSHVLGQAEAVSSPFESARQLLAARKRPPGTAAVDAMTAYQVSRHRDAGPRELLAQLRRRLPQAARARRRLPWRSGRLRLRIEVPQPDGSIVKEPWTFAYASQVYTRDLWMHRADLDGVGVVRMQLTPAHDGRLVADVVRDWASRHGEPFELTLTGPAGGRWVQGTGGPRIERDAVDFCRSLFGRAPATVPTAVVPF